MRLGILADIHEQNECLRESLRELQREGVDRIISLGDICANGRALEDTVRLLREYRVEGVWGNHDFGLCRDVSTEDRARYSTTVLEYMAELKPRLVVDGCLFTHIEPWLDPEDPAQLWHFEDGIESPERLARIFSASAQDVMFMGHLHRWMALTPSGRLPWTGHATLSLERGQSYLIVVNAGLSGHRAVYDTSSRDLTPMAIDTFVTIEE